METAGIKEIKNNLSRYLARVKAGEEVLITERGRPIARIIKEAEKGGGVLRRLAPLIENGLVTLPSRPMKKAGRTWAAVSGGPVSDMVAEDRR